MDDFLFVAPVDGDLCRFLLDTFRFFMEHFGIPLSADKTEGPVSVLSFLGIEIDSVNMVFRLPRDKLSNLISLIDVFCSVHKVMLQQLQSLLLVFAFRIMLSLATRGITRPSHTHYQTTACRINGGTSYKNTRAVCVCRRQIWSCSLTHPGLVALEPFLGGGGVKLYGLRHGLSPACVEI